MKDWHFILIIITQKGWALLDIYFDCLLEVNEYVALHPLNLTINKI